MIVELTGCKISSINVTSPNTICLLPKESDNPSEKVRKSWDLDDTKQALFNTNDAVVKEGNTDMVEKKEKEI